MGLNLSKRTLDVRVNHVTLSRRDSWRAFRYRRPIVLSDASANALGGLFTILCERSIFGAVAINGCPFVMSRPSPYPSASFSVNMVKDNSRALYVLKTFGPFSYPIDRLFRFILFYFFFVLDKSFDRLLHAEQWPIVRGGGGLYIFPANHSKDDECTRSL